MSIIIYFICTYYLNGRIKIKIKSGMGKNENDFKVRGNILRKRNLHERNP